MTGAVDLGVDRQKQFCEEVTTVRDVMTNPTEILALIFIGGFRRGESVFGVLFVAEAR